jgi:hypothetical protein
LRQRSEGEDEKRGEMANRHRTFQYRKHTMR